MSSEVHISVVSPIYKGEKMVAELVRRIKDNVLPITESYEIILVNDASPDNSWEEIKKECATDTRVKGIDLSRNFGQHYAITAGLNYAKGEWVVVMDCDLQDRPEEIPNLYNKAQEGWDSVFAQRIRRSDGFIKRMSSKAFYALFSYLTETKQDPSVANFGIYNRKVINAILSMHDHIKYFPTMVQWVGFRKYYLPIVHDERLEGKSSYSFGRLLHLAIDTIIAFSDKPLRIAAKLGLIIAFGALIVGVIYLSRFYMGDIEVLGYTSIVISVWFLGGIIIFLCGVLGIYLGKTFEKVKGRPVFIMDRHLNC